MERVAHSPARVTAIVGRALRIADRKTLLVGLGIESEIALVHFGRSVAVEEDHQRSIGRQISRHIEMIGILDTLIFEGVFGQRTRTIIGSGNVPHRKQCGHEQ